MLAKRAPLKRDRHAREKGTPQARTPLKHGLSICQNTSNHPKTDRKSRITKIVVTFGMVFENRVHMLAGKRSRR